MKEYIKHHEWKIIEDSFNPEYNEVSESIFSIGNGHMGQRANFEEKYSGDTFQGSYLAGVYYPDKTRVGWWKNGYPEYFAKVLNSVNWIGIDISINEVALDLNTCQIKKFYRELDMQQGVLKRSIVATNESGIEFTINAERFVSLVRSEIGAIRYSITINSSDARIELNPYLDANVQNSDANYDENFWNQLEHSSLETSAYLTTETRKTEYRITSGMRYALYCDGSDVTKKCGEILKEGYVSHQLSIDVKQGQEITLEKFAAIVTSRDYHKDELKHVCAERLNAAYTVGYAELYKEQREAWLEKWEHCDVIIEGDLASQQGIRYNIFQLNQTYTGHDARLNIGPKGFTGEKYGGASYWDTEAFCLQFYLSTANPNIAKNLLLYRYHHLEKAIQNARLLGFENGAALFPMVTMNGEECHNEWEITFEEIHRNGAMAFAIYNYVNCTQDKSYLTEYGLEVLIALSRFWSQRFQYSTHRNQYVMLGVTGPNEYENNVNNNWYTSFIARWTIEYTLEVMRYVTTQNSAYYNKLLSQLAFDKTNEIARFKDIIANTYLPHDEAKGIFLQQDGFLDKELLPVAELDTKHLPLHQNWSWDRVLRSCYIKQADVLQGIYLFHDTFSKQEIERNFDFYEPLTVHESSLSPSIHSVIASRIGRHDKALELYLRAARLDLDDYNNDTKDGLHITSMVGSWLSLVQGFGGMSYQDGLLSFQPSIPNRWNRYSFKMVHLGTTLKFSVTSNQIEVSNEGENDLLIRIADESLSIKPGRSHSLSF